MLCGRHRREGGPQLQGHEARSRGLIRRAVFELGSARGIRLVWPLMGSLHVEIFQFRVEVKSESDSMRDRREWRVVFVGTVIWGSRLTCMGLVTCSLYALWQALPLDVSQGL